MGARGGAQLLLHKHPLSSSFQLVEYMSDLRRPGHEGGDSADDFLVPIEEQAASLELLGAAKYDR